MLLLRYTLYCFIITFIKQQKTHSILTQRTLFVLNNSEILSYSNVSYILPPLWQVNLEKVLNCFQKLFQSCCIRRSSPSNCQKLYQPFDHTLPTPTLTYEEYLLKIFILPPIWSNPVKTRHYLSACAFCHSLPVGLDILSSYIYMDNLYEETS